MTIKEDEISAADGGETMPNSTEIGVNERREDPLTRKEVSEQMDEETADIVVQAIDELAVRANEIAELKEELDQVTNQLKRQAAEFQNYRRRTEQEKEQMVSFGKSMVVQQILDVVDDFQRSLEAAEQTGIESGADGSAAFDSLKSGVEMVYQKLLDELKKMNVEQIETIGQVFNEDFHEALMQQPAAAGQQPGIILTEIQSGWRMGDRVLRHSKVVVSV